MTLAGLIETPEVCLTRACLRRLNDPADTIAAAEVRALGSCEEPEVWLADRLRWLAAEEEDRSWADTDDPIVSCIAPFTQPHNHPIPGRDSSAGTQLCWCTTDRDRLGTWRDHGYPAPAQP